MEFTELEIQEIVDQWGREYIPGGQTEKDIKKMIFTEDDISADFVRIPNKGSKYRSSYATIEEVLQAFQVPFLPKGDTTFKPVEYQLGQFKVDVTLSPDKFRRSWLGFLARVEEVDRAKWPFIKWYIINLLMGRMTQDFIEKVAYYGWEVTDFVAANPVVNEETFVREFVKGEKTPANAAMDGIFLTLMKLHGMGRTNTITVSGGWSNDPEAYCTQVENFIKSIPHKFRGRLDNLYVNKTRHDLYRAGKKLKYNQYYNQEMNLDTIWDQENIRIKGTHAMVGSDKHWITFPENRVKPVQAEKTNRFMVERNKRVVDIYNDWGYTLALDVPEFVWHCDQELLWTPQMLEDHYGIEDN